jgi:hypothetical protein
MPQGATRSAYLSMRVVWTVPGSKCCFLVCGRSVPSREQKKPVSLPADLPVVTRERMKKRLLFVERLENAFFCLENLTFRTSPGIRNLIPGRSRGNAIFGITSERIIDIMAFKTHIPDHFYQFSHGFFNSI